MLPSYKDVFKDMKILKIALWNDFIPSPITLLSLDLQEKCPFFRDML